MVLSRARVFGALLRSSVVCGWVRDGWAFRRCAPSCRGSGATGQARQCFIFSDFEGNFALPTSVIASPCLFSQRVDFGEHAPLSFGPLHRTRLIEVVGNGRTTNRSPVEKTSCSGSRKYVLQCQVVYLGRLEGLISFNAWG